MATVLAADLGGTSTKAALVSSDGEILAEASVPAPAPGISGLILPPDWWNGFREAAGKLKAEKESEFASIAAIAVTGVTRTPVILDELGNSLAGAIGARDARAQEIAALTRIDPEFCAEAAHYDGFHPAARLKWIQKNFPRALTHVKSVVDPKDLVAAQLTGRIASDPIAMTRLAAAASTNDGPSLLSRLDLPEEIVPDLLQPTSIIDRTRTSLPEPFDTLAGKPVVMASHDTWAGVVGLGALTPGRAYNVSGTTETFGVMTTTPVKAGGLMDVEWGNGLHQIGGPGQNGADVLSWLGTLIGADAQDEIAGRIARALAKPRHERPLLFLPYLSGERVPFWDADLRAAFLGLSREHGPADLVWATLEGIAFLNRIVLGRAEAAARIKVDEVRLGGGAAKIGAWAQIKADVLERPVSTVVASEPGVLGAAIAAFVGLGTFTTLSDAQQLLVRTARVFDPRPEKRDFYRSLGLLFGQAHDAVRPLSHQLTKLAVPQ
jgi:xylulokinase